MAEHASARILVVDDDAGSRMTLDVVLFCAGYDVATAANGEEALGWLMQRDFDLVLVDPRLPGMSGIELARHAKTCQPAAKLLFVIGADDTADAPPQPRDAAYLRKTSNPEEVAYLVDALLSSQTELRMAA